jgi:hypothetical protein
MKKIERYIFDDPKRLRKIVCIFPVAIVFLILLQDYIHSYINNYSYYLAESLLFSSFWLIFFPLIYLQYRWQVKTNEPRFINGIFVSTLLMFVHLFGFPILLFFLSKLFYTTLFLHQLLIYTFRTPLQNNYCLLNYFSFFRVILRRLVQRYTSSKNI